MRPSVAQGERQNCVQRHPIPVKEHAVTTSGSLARIVNQILNRPGGGHAKTAGENLNRPRHEGTRPSLVPRREGIGRPVPAWPGGCVLRLGATRNGLNLLPQHVVCNGAAVCTAWRHSTWSRARERGRNSLPSALPLTAGSRRDRFAGWLCVCLLLLQAFVVSCHEPGALSEMAAGADGAVPAIICSAAGSPVQPADGSPEKPAKGGCACAFHTCGCCPAILSVTVNLLPRAAPAAARTSSYRGVNLAANTILRHASVRGPPAFLT
jgi:Protein of unknown function (DUF2946)